MSQQLRQISNKILARALSYARAWRCSDKILVIESDDWGAIRTSTAKAYQTLVARGYEMDRSCWSVDALEASEDLETLFEVIGAFGDSRGCPACITGNMVMANPDFSAIQKSNFHEYVYEPVATTLAASPERHGVARLWKEGMESKVFRPQFHAREHVRWWQWMEALQKGSPEALETFDLGMCGVPLAASKEKQSFFEPPYIDSSLINRSDVDLKDIIKEGIRLFEKQFGFQSLSTIAPNCTWTDIVEQAWEEHGVRYIQGEYCQHLVTDGGLDLIPHYLGKRSLCNGRYLVRNCTFEPVKDERDDYWEVCLNQIARSFRLKIPAIVSSHRVNYVGSIKKINREKGLTQLRKLLTAVTSRWPDVNFLSSAELGYMIENGISQVRDLDGHKQEIFPSVAEETRDLCTGGKL